MNNQHWDFVVSTDPTQLQKLSEIWQYGGHVAHSAVTVVLVAPIAASERAGEIDQYDMGQVTMSMMLAAADLGIGSGHAAVGNQVMARELLDLPEDRYCVAMIAFGYPKDRPLVPLTKINRRPIGEVVHRGHW